MNGRKQRAAAAERRGESKSSLFTLLSLFSLLLPLLLQTECLLHLDHHHHHHHLLLHLHDLQLSPVPHHLNSPTPCITLPMHRGHLLLLNSLLKPFENTGLSRCVITFKLPLRLTSPLLTVASLSQCHEGNSADPGNISPSRWVTHFTFSFRTSYKSGSPTLASSSSTDGTTSPCSSSSTSSTSARALPPLCNQAREMLTSAFRITQPLPLPGRPTSSRRTSPSPSPIASATRRRRRPRDTSLHETSFLVCYASSSSHNQL